MNHSWTGQMYAASQQNLNGAWDFCVWDGERPPEQIPSGLPWQVGAYQVEAVSGSGRQFPAGLLRRRLNVASRESLRAWLRFERCGGPVVFYLNGRRFYANPESCLPVELDIQDHIVSEARTNIVPAAGPGENELVIWRGAGEGALQGAEMVYLPAVSIPDLVVRPRKGLLGLEITLENRTWERFEGRLELSLLGTGQVGLPLAAQEVALECGLLTTLAVRAAWGGERAWSLRDPWLYEVEARLFGKTGLLDARRVRFGLREARCQGGEWILNGKPIQSVPAVLGEVPDLPSALNTLARLKENGVTLLRLDSPYPGFVLDAADQVGVLVECRVSNWPQGSLSPDPAFEDADQDHLRRLARRHRNHPSLAAWVLDGGKDTMKLVEVLRGMDLARPIFTGRSSQKIQAKG